ncbi:hypothetical protein Nepgr_014631 [Nepenthes gracilis]|uniref:Ubiquitin-like domain-containing protein n=1 Tax=Nepenthes gracilis TaxID=150966 RepID=A0AAD3SL75_NEPGR|nr:hypothetical protein Nepgr_014631 [Nepenthes gracilis]
MERDATGAGGVIKLQIKFGGETIPISLSSDSTVSELKFLLQSSTNVLPRGQKLIHKGKILEDSKTLGSSEISNGSKIMLMASQGLHQADGPMLKGAPIVSNYQRIVSADRNPSRFVEQVSVDKSRAERWKITGVVALSECHLKVIPDEVWDCGSAARVLDLSNNHICDVPAKIGSLTHIQKMMLNANEISDDFISWEGLTYLKSLTYLSLSQNHLTALPSALGTLTTLRQLHIASNILKSLPCELGLLMHLEVLNISNNRISTIPACIGGCHSLIEVDLSSNLLVTLPETFGNLQNLKALHVRNNGLKSLPSTLFKKCLKLSTLDLHGTEITMDMLRLAEGWEEFDKRRRLKHQKQLDFRAGGSAEFDEGADRN